MKQNVLRDHVNAALRSARKRYTEDATLRTRAIDSKKTVGWNFSYGIELIYDNAENVEWLTLQRGAMSPTVIQLDREPAFDVVLSGLFDEVAGLLKRLREQIRTNVDRIETFRRTAHDDSDTGNILEQVVWDALKNSKCPLEHRYMSRYGDAGLPCRWCRAAQSAIGIIRHMIGEGVKPEEMMARLEVLAGWSGKAEMEELERGFDNPGLPE